MNNTYTAAITNVTTIVIHRRTCIRTIVHPDICSYRILNKPSQITDSVVVAEIKKKEKPYTYLHACWNIDSYAPKELATVTIFWEELADL